VFWNRGRKPPVPIRLIPHLPGKINNTFHGSTGLPNPSAKIFLTEKVEIRILHAAKAVADQVCDLYEKIPRNAGTK